MSDKPDLAIQITVMALREELMEYFKGTCVERITKNRNITSVDCSTSGGYFFERRQQANERPKIVVIGSVPIMTLRSAPDRVVFNASLNRSSQLREVRKELEEFLDTYLSGVKKEYNDANITTV